MSYTRWNSALGLDVRKATGHDDIVDAWVAWHAIDRERQDAEIDRQGATRSQWYIYHDAASDPELGRNGQLLAVWHTSAAEHPLIDYGELRRVADAGDWSFIPGYDECTDAVNRQLLQTCVIEWLEDVESDYPAAAPLSRLELARHWAVKAQRHCDEVRAGDRWALLKAGCAAQRVHEITLRAAKAADREADAAASLVATIATDLAEAETLARQTEAASNAAGTTGNTDSAG